MAILMNGNPIEALRLKASDGSTRTVNLTESGTIPTPTGSQNITSNGTYNVMDDAQVNVSVDQVDLVSFDVTSPDLVRRYHEFSYNGYPRGVVLYMMPNTNMEGTISNPLGADNGDDLYDVRFNTIAYFSAYHITGEKGLDKPCVYMAYHYDFSDGSKKMACSAKVYEAEGDGGLYMNSGFSWDNNDGSRLENLVSFNGEKCRIRTNGKYGIRAGSYMMKIW